MTQWRVERLKRSLVTKFEVKDLGQMQYFFGMEVARSKRGIIVSQRKCIHDLKETSMLGCKPCDTPLDMGRKLKTVETLFGRIDINNYLEN